MMVVEFNKLEDFLAEVTEECDPIRAMIHAEPRGEGCVEMFVIAGYIRLDNLHELRLSAGMEYVGPSEDGVSEQVTSIIDQISSTANTHGVRFLGGKFVAG